MKKIVFLLVLLCILFSVGFTKDGVSTLSEAQIKTMLCHKWKLTYLEYNGKKKEIPAKLPQSLLIFLPEGKLQEFEGDKKYDGKWTYDHDTKTVITVDQDGTESHKIIALTNDQFIMNGKFKGFIFNMGLKKVE